MDIFQNAPLDTKLYLICSDCRLYVGTLTKSVRGDIVRGECYEGDADTFYRCAVIAWAYYDK